jgi:hypothetical protein
MFHLSDWLPTLLEMSGHDPVDLLPSDIDGIGQFNYLKNDDGLSKRSELFYHHMMTGSAYRWLQIMLLYLIPKASIVLTLLIFVPELATSSSSAAPPFGRRPPTCPDSSCSTSGTTPRKRRT